MKQTRRCDFINNVLTLTSDFPLTIINKVRSLPRPHFYSSVLDERGALIIAVRRRWSNRKRVYDSRAAIVVRRTLDTIRWTYLEKRGKPRSSLLGIPRLTVRGRVTKKLYEFGRQRRKNNWNSCRFPIKLGSNLVFRYCMEFLFLVKLLSLDGNVY